MAVDEIRYDYSIAAWIKQRLHYNNWTELTKENLPFWLMLPKIKGLWTMP
jgi:hypothetical protein